MSSPTFAAKNFRSATSAVTAKRKVVTYRKQASRMASFDAVRNDREPLSNPYQTRDLCPALDFTGDFASTIAAVWQR